MRIFVDSANIEEIERWMLRGVVDGVTTNPSLCLKAGVHGLEKHQREVAMRIRPLPLSVEVTTNDPGEMVRQARVIAGWADNINVKIPIINEDGDSCLGVIKALRSEGIAVNATVLMSLSQVMLATKAGATFVSVFAGRVGDGGGDAAQLIHDATAWLDRWGYPARLIVGSIRSVADIQRAAVAGAHILTIPPPMLDKMLDHHSTRATVREFNEDARKALEGAKS